MMIVNACVNSEDNRAAANSATLTYHSTRGRHRCARRRRKLQTRDDRDSDFDVFALDCTPPPPAPAPRLSTPITHTQTIAHRPETLLRPVNYSVLTTTV